MTVKHEFPNEENMHGIAEVKLKFSEHLPILSNRKHFRGMTCLSQAFVAQAWRLVQSPNV